MAILETKMEEVNDGGDESQQQQRQQGTAIIEGNIVSSGSKRHWVNGRALRKEKQRRWEAKQLRLQQQQLAASISTHTIEGNVDQLVSLSWLERNSRFCTLVTMEDVELVKSGLHNNNANLGLLERIHPYFDLKNHQQPLNIVSSERLFIAEGAETVRLLIRQLTSRHNNNGSENEQDADCYDCPKIQILSIFVKRFIFFDASNPILKEVEQVKAHQNAKHCKEEEKQQLPFDVLLGSDDVLTAVAGFPITRGALACGVVPAWDERWLMSYLGNFRRNTGGKDNTGNVPQLRLLALDAITDTANLGSMIRCASAFGVHAVILSDDCCDAWYRRSIRVSMGHVFRVPTVRVNDLTKTIAQLSSPPFAVTFYAAVIDPNADLLLENLDQVPKAWCCILGNEAKGIRPSVANACHQRIRIDMVDGVDSLSVPIAAGILLHGLRERENCRRRINGKDE